MNQITHWLDGSNIYGSSEKAANELRTNFGGQLKITRQTGSRAGVLPSCGSRRRNRGGVSMCQGCSSCFFAGLEHVFKDLDLQLKPFSSFLR